MIRTSTRNAYPCRVTAVTEGAVHTLVQMELAGGQPLCAALTLTSAAEMGLAPGTEVLALVKASFVILAAGTLPGPVSARNVLTGTVAARRDGAVYSEIVLDIGGGQTVTATITIDSADRLGLAAGDTATALFKAGHVILALP